VAEMILIALLAVLGYVGSLYLWPFRPCGRCKGTSRNPGSNKKRFGQCRRCGGAGRKRRIGAKTVHRGAVSLAERASRKGVRK
jgi:DnaJ-class molecular chaperone